MQGLEGVDAAPVELHAAAYPVGSGAEDYHGAVPLIESHVVGLAVVRKVEVVGA